MKLKYCISSYNENYTRSLKDNITEKYDTYHDDAVDDNIVHDNIVDDNIVDYIKSAKKTEDSSPNLKYILLAIFALIVLVGLVCIIAISDLVAIAWNFLVTCVFFKYSTSCPIVVLDDKAFDQLKT